MVPSTCIALNAYALAYPLKNMAALLTNAQESLVWWWFSSLCLLVFNLNQHYIIIYLISSTPVAKKPRQTGASLQMQLQEKSMRLIEKELIVADKKIALMDEMIKFYRARNADDQALFNMNEINLLCDSNPIEKSY